MAHPENIGVFTVRHLIGTGSFASVMLGEHSPSGIRVAIKVVDVESAREELRTRFIRELSLLKQMDHPFICKLYQVIEQDHFVYLIQEYLENGTLFSYVNQQERMSELQARRLFTQLIAAVEYLHETKQVVHRDIKAENVLLDSYGNIRLIDFGLSNVFTSDDPMLHTACGSPAYVAPEMILGKPYTKSADLWSAGVLLYAMVIGELPFAEASNLQDSLRNVLADEPKYPDWISCTLADLLRKILTKDPERRIDLQHLKAHPWFSHSEYLKIFQMSFSEEEWLVSAIDRDLIHQMGIDVRIIIEAILRGEFTTETAIYSMVRRRKIMAQMADVMEWLTQALASSCTMLTSSTRRAKVFKKTTTTTEDRTRRMILPPLGRRRSVGRGGLPRQMVVPPAPPMIRTNLPDLKK
jgi:serine/threonine protein kinase